MRYCLLGLGDTNYDAFCNAAIKLDQALKKAGALQLAPTALADDGTGLETVVEPWRLKIKEILLAWTTEQQAKEAAPTKVVGSNDQPQPHVWFLYASQLGNAKEISAHLQSIAQNTFQSLATSYSSCADFARTFKNV